MQEFHPDVLQDLCNWQTLRNKSPKYTSSAQKILICQAKGQKAAEVSQEAAEELVQGIPWGEEKQDF